MYDDADYAHSRLAGTIVRRAGIPVEVHAIQNGGFKGLVATVVELKMKTTEEMPQYEQVSYKELDVTPVPLGFCSTARGVTYLQRLPKRHDWRQGLRRANYLSAWGVDSRFVNYLQLHNTILGRYPGMELALDESDNLGMEVPFCREFCIQTKRGGPKLLYKWFGEVGNFVNGKVGLHDKYQFLQEILDERVA